MPITLSSRLLLGLLGGQSGGSTPPSPPDTPTGLSAGQNASGVVSTLTPTYSVDYDDDATGYFFQRNTSASAVGATTFPEQSVPYYTEASALDISSDYYVRAYATNADGDSAWSDWIGPLNVIYVTQTFTQALGSQLLANPEFDNVTSTNLDNWTEEGSSGSDPDISAIAEDGSAGTGAAHLVSSATANRPTAKQDPIFTVGALYEHEIDVAALTGKLKIWQGGNQPKWPGEPAIEVVGNFRVLDIPSHTYYELSGAVAPCDARVTRASAKLVTPNETIAVGADGAIEIKPTTPGSPRMKERLNFYFRAGDNGSGAIDPNNCLRVQYYFYEFNSTWRIQLQSISSGTVTALKSSTNIGAIDRVRVTFSGTTVTAEYRPVSGSYATIGGSAATDSVHSARTLSRVDHTSGFTLNEFAAGKDTDVLGAYTGPEWHLDQSFVGDSDGSESAPWTSAKQAFENSGMLDGHTLILHDEIDVDESFTLTKAINVEAPTGEHYRLHLAPGKGITIAATADGTIWDLMWVNGTNTERTSAQDTTNPTDIVRNYITCYANVYWKRARYFGDLVSSGIGLWDAGGAVLEGAIFINNGWAVSVPGAHDHGHCIAYIQNGSGQDITLKNVSGAGHFNTQIRLGGTVAADQSDLQLQDVDFFGGQLYLTLENDSSGLDFTGLGFWLDAQVYTPSTSDKTRLLSILNSHWYTTDYPFIFTKMTPTLTGNHIARKGGGTLVMRMTDDDTYILANYTLDNNDYYTEAAGEPTVQNASPERALSVWKVDMSPLDANSTGHSSAPIPDSVKVVKTQDGYGTVRITNAVALADTVVADVTGLNLTNGVSYIARNDQDPLNDTFTFTYLSDTGVDNGDGTIDVDMRAISHSVADPLGLTATDLTSAPEVLKIHIEPNYAL